MSNDCGRSMCRLLLPPDAVVSRFEIPRLAGRWVSSTPPSPQRMAQGAGSPTEGKVTSSAGHGDSWGALLGGPGAACTDPAGGLGRPRFVWKMPPPPGCTGDGSRSEPLQQCGAGRPGHGGAEEKMAHVAAPSRPGLKAQGPRVPTGSRVHLHLPSMALAPPLGPHGCHGHRSR